MGGIPLKAGISGRKRLLSGGKCHLFARMPVSLEEDIFLEGTVILGREKWYFWCKMSSSWDNAGVCGRTYPIFG